MVKYIANAITSLRIIGSVVLLFFDVSSLPFYITYLLCGFSDMIDGTIARKTNAVTEFGSKLDTVADFVFVAVCLIIAADSYFCLAIDMDCCYSSYQSH